MGSGHGPGPGVQGVWWAADRLRNTVRVRDRVRDGKRAASAGRDIRAVADRQGVSEPVYLWVLGAGCCGRLC